MNEQAKEVKSEWTERLEKKFDWCCNHPYIFGSITYILGALIGAAATYLFVDKYVEIAMLSEKLLEQTSGTAQSSSGASSTPPTQSVATTSTQVAAQFSANAKWVYSFFVGMLSGFFVWFSGYCWRNIREMREASIKHLESVEQNQLYTDISKSYHGIETFKKSAALQPVA